MRGKVGKYVLLGSGFGITPAHAGKSACAASARGGLKDHPRACGEKPMRIIWEHAKQGSPPRMRGKVLFCSTCVRFPGITPAHAGKSIARCLCGFPRKDHPRACGEKFHSGSHFHLLVGSPPRMRGKEKGGVKMAIIKGITPAHAGKRPSVLKSLLLYKDHPRACGEKQIPKMNVSRSKGSPPRMRGKAFSSSVVPCAKRITPAHAGKS